MPHKKKQKPEELNAESLENMDITQDEDSLRAELDHIDAIETVDEEVKDIFQEAQGLDYGREDLARKLESYTDKTPELTGGDVDASWEYADVGEETVGGQNPTPDQSVVDDTGAAVGLTYQDNEPLAVDDKVGERDQEPWELNPASSPDYSERVAAEFHEPLEKIVVQPAGEPQDAAAKKRVRQPPASRRVPAGHSVTARAARGAGGRTRTAKAGRATGTRNAKGRATVSRGNARGAKTKGRRAAPSRQRGTRR